MGFSHRVRPGSETRPAAPGRRRVLSAAAAALTIGAAPVPVLPARRSRPRDIPGADALPTPSLLLAADQASERVLVLDPGDSSWCGTDGRRQRSAERAALWSWSPADDRSLDHLVPARTWRLVSEAKYRVRLGRQWVLTCASLGLAAVVPYPTGRAYWATATDGNLHTIELLPDGNVAVTASEAGFVRVYAASQGPQATHCAQFDLPGAHGLQWDDARNVLWALGDRQLVALHVGGTPDAPQLTAAQVVDLPDSGGHDLSLVAVDPFQLWVSTAAHVYQYAVDGGGFTPYFGQQDIDRPGVKSVGDDPATGQVLTVTPDVDRPGVWSTSTVEFHAPDGRRHIDGASLYKARWLPGAPFSGLGGA